MQIQTLNERISVLESEKSSLQASANKLEAHVNDLDSQILALEDQLSSANEEKRTLQQRVELLLTELNAETPGKFYYLFSWSQCFAWKGFSLKCIFVKSACYLGIK